MIEKKSEKIKNKKKSLLVTSGARTARKTCTQSIRKNDLYGQSMTFSQKALLFY